MKRLAALAIVSAVGVWLTAIVSAQGGVPASVRFVSHDSVAAMFTKGGALVEDPGLAILAQHRGAGAPEWHEHTNHIFMVMAGEATLVVGGTLVGARQSAPGQMRAESIEGGRTHRLSKG